MKKKARFTLIEILIAIFIFAIIVSTVFGSYNFIFSNAENINKGIENSEMAKNCLDRMIYDLKSMHIILPPEYSIPDTGDDSDPYRIKAETEYRGDTGFAKLRFTSTAHLPFRKDNRQGVAQIVYYVQEDSEGNYVLRRSDTLYPYAPVEEKGDDNPVLCEQVKSLVFKFYDQNGAEYDYWDSESKNFDYATPKAVKMQLELGDNVSPLSFETTVILPVYREKQQ